MGRHRSIGRVRSCDSAGNGSRTLLRSDRGIDGIYKSSSFISARSGAIARSAVVCAATPLQSGFEGQGASHMFIHPAESET